jgi:hypothetical protein
MPIVDALGPLVEERCRADKDWLRLQGGALLDVNLF